MSLGGRKADRAVDPRDLRAIERGELRAARLCSRLRIPRAAFDEWIERSTVRPAESPPAPPPPPMPAGSFRALLARREERPQ